jgi:transmembrane 9 superfamily protein 2/4
LYNHLKFTINYQDVDTADGNGVYITGFDVHPVSIQHEADGVSCAGTGSDQKGIVNDPKTYLPLRTGDNKDMAVTYSYEVEWVLSELPWEDRWDVYLIGSPDDDIHFFAIVNSLMIVLFLTGAIATIMIRTLRKDISAYNEMSMLEDGSEETGWKLVHGDVFRPPQTSPLALAVLVGNGAQIGTATFISMLAAMLKLLNPIKKGHTLTALLVLYVLSGCVAGYVSARIYKFCDAKAWKMNTLMTAMALPSCLVGIFTVLNIFLSFAGAATAVSFLTLLAIFALWICVSAPLVFVGSFFGYRAEKFSVPTKTNQIARVVPELPWYNTPPVSYLLGGILPFGSVCIELFFIMSALWLHQIYYVMGFLLAVLMILAATCAQVAVVMDYLQLCGEDHRWWWKSFFNCASAGIYLFLYSLWFLASRLELVGVLPVVVYLTYMSMISVLFGLFCGSMGFMTAFWFNRTIYGALKVD